MNAQERGALDGQMRANSGKINDLRRQQAAANARLFGMGLRANIPDSSGYPWAGAPFPNEIPDPWGMYQRQCVSYTAWKVWKSGRYMPYWGGRGNANQWDDNARAAGIPTDGSPRAGDVAISNSGYYGHAMYVEAVYGDGTIYVSQYNAGWTGTYSEARIPIGSLVFIHF
jgi:surface antigen